MPRKTSVSKNHMQLAVALSSSLKEAEEQEISKLTEALPASAIEKGVVPQNVADMQKQFLKRFETRKPGHNKKAPHVKHSKPAPALLARSLEDRTRIVTEKVALLLLKDYDIVEKCDGHEAGSTLQPSEASLQENMLWEISSTSSANSNNYYIKNLNPHVLPSNDAVETRLNKPRIVPGSLITPVKRSQSRTQIMSQEDVCISGTRLCPIPSTSSLNHLSKEQMDLQSDLEKIVNSSTFSDVTIVSKEKTHLYAHKIILFSRCPSIIKDIDCDNLLRWITVPHRSIFAFLNYLYCGKLNAGALTAQDFSGVVFLANKYKLSDVLKTGSATLNTQDCRESLSVTHEQVISASSPHNGGLQRVSISPGDLFADEEPPSELPSSQQVSDDLQCVTNSQDMISKTLTNCKDIDSKDENKVFNFFGTCNPPQNSLSGSCNESDEDLILSSVRKYKPSLTSRYGPKKAIEVGIENHPNVVPKPSYSNHITQRCSHTEELSPGLKSTSTGVETHQHVTKEYVSKSSCDKSDGNIEANSPSSEETPPDLHFRTRFRSTWEDTQHMNKTHVSESSDDSDGACLINSNPSPSLKCVSSEGNVSWLILDTPPEPKRAVTKKRAPKSDVKKKKATAVQQNSQIGASPSGIFIREAKEVQSNNALTTNVCLSQCSSHSGRSCESDYVRLGKLVVDSTEYLRKVEQQKVLEELQEASMRHKSPIISIREPEGVQINAPSRESVFNDHREESLACDEPQNSPSSAASVTLIRERKGVQDTAAQNEICHPQQSSKAKKRKQGSPTRRELVFISSSSDEETKKQKHEESVSVPGPSQSKILYKRYQMPLFAPVGSSSKHEPEKVGKRWATKSLSGYSKLDNLTQKDNSSDLTQRFHSKSKSMNNDNQTKRQSVDASNNDLCVKENLSKVAQSSNLQVDMRNSTSNTFNVENIKVSSPVTPMPNYEAFTSSQLEEEVEKYGLKKNMSRSRSIKMLNFIYEQLHPIVEVVPQEKRETLETDCKTITHPKIPCEDKAGDSESQTDEESSSPVSSSNSKDSIVLEETIFVEEEQSASGGESMDLQTVVRSWITTQPEIYEMILSYEPLWLNTTLQEFQTLLGKKISANELMNVLDEEGITFRTEQGQHRKRRKDASKKRKTSQKRSDV